MPEASSKEGKNDWSLGTLKVELLCGIQRWSRDGDRWLASLWLKSKRKCQEGDAGLCLKEAFSLHKVPHTYRVPFFVLFILLFLFAPIVKLQNLNMAIVGSWLVEFHR